MKSILVAALTLGLVSSVLAQTYTTRTDTTSTPEPSTAATSSSDNVKRALFSSGVTDREPVDELTTLATPVETVYFFTELVGMAGRTVTHTWKLDGQTVSEVAISVGSDRWRCWTTKSMSSAKAGTWTVEVADDAGTKLAEKSLTTTASG